MADIKDQKLLYHLTSLRNLSSILEGGLQPRSALREFHDVADPEIIDGRKHHNLDGYVPFHWFSRNPFDGRVQCDKPNEDFILITVRRTLAQARNWKIILRHPLANAHVELHDYKEGFELIDWVTMNKRDYHDPDCKNICMAECLSPSTVNVSQFFKIFVPEDGIRNVVLEEAKQRSLAVDVSINGNMFN